MTVQSPADFGIIVALDLELQAVLRLLGKYERVENSTKDVRTYYVGEFPTSNGSPYKIVVTSPLQAGNTTAALATKDLIDRWSPAHILMIGIAAGLQPKEWIDMGFQAQ